MRRESSATPLHRLLAASDNAAMWELLAKIFGDDLHRAHTFDLAKLTLAGWLVSASMIAVIGTFIAVAVGSRVMGDNPPRAAAWVEGFAALVVGIAWFKLLRMLAGRFGISLYKHDEGDSDRQ